MKGTVYRNDKQRQRKIHPSLPTVSTVLSILFPETSCSNVTSGRYKKNFWSSSRLAGSRTEDEAVNDDLRQLETVTETSVLCLSSL